MHHAKIIELLEQARLELLKAAGFPQEALFERDLWIVISRINIEYLREIKDEEYTITCEEFNLRRRVIVIKQRMINEKGKDAVEAVVECMCYRSELGRAVTPPEDLANALIETINAGKCVELGAARSEMVVGTGQLGEGHLETGDLKTGTLQLGSAIELVN